MTEDVLNELYRLIELEMDKCESPEETLAYAKCVLIILKVFREQQMNEERANAKEVK